VFLAQGLSTVDRDLQGEEEADLVIRRVPLGEAVRMVLAGEIVNGPAISGVLAAQAVVAGAEARPQDASWPDRPHTFAARSKA
jgi:ADP-ribose pyrophosphatase